MYRRTRTRLKKHPPKTRRWCVNCKKMTKWKYNPHVFHSECTECGCRTALKVPPKGRS